MEQLLERLGLSPAEATLYRVLLERGRLSGGEAIAATGLKRGHTYNLLARLVQRGLVREDRSGAKTQFFLESPKQLATLISDQATELTKLQSELTDALPGLVSQFKLVNKKPDVRFYEGTEGLRLVYQDILAVGQSLALVRSPYHPVYEKEFVPTIVKDFIRRRVKKGMHVEALTPRDHNQSVTPADDQRMLMDRTWLATQDYTAPVEIDLYDDRVAFLSFGEELIGTIIESPQIAQAMRELFALARRGAAASRQAPNPSEPNSHQS